MELVIGVHHAFVKLPVAVRELIVDVQIPDPAAVCQIRQIRINAVDFRHNIHIVVARKDSHQYHHRIWSLRFPLPNEVARGIWNWEKLGKECGLSGGPGTLAP